MPRRYDQETRSKAIRPVIHHVGDDGSEWEAITTVAGRLGMSSEPLKKWVRLAGIDAGQAPGVTSESAREIRELRRRNAELERTVDRYLRASEGAAADCQPEWPW